MPYVIFTANGEEYDRRELRGPLVLGRAPDCDVAVPDITLSRHHCRLEPSENGRAWQIVDLHSKNGTHFLGQAVEHHVLREKDELRIGRTRLTFRAGEFVRSNKVKTRGMIRPVDPHEALAGTVSGMVVCEPGDVQRHEGMPIPQPRPSDPMSFQKDDIYGMINEIASSSWDSIQAQASKPTRMQRATPVPAMTQANRGNVRPKPRVSFALQADHEEENGNGKANARRNDASDAAAKPAKMLEPSRPSRTVMLAVASVIVTGVLIAGWMTMLATTAHGGDQATPAAAPKLERKPQTAIPKIETIPQPAAYKSAAPVRHSHEPAAPHSVDELFLAQLRAS